jgi:U32 family peptidase
MQSKVEILAPAGDEACLDAALAAGADAVYFGLDSGFNARARAMNLRTAHLRDVMDKIHDWGRRGYLTMNTLVFDHELAAIERLIHLAAEAGVDALIVQDFAVMRLARRMAPTLRLHASTQTTCTDRAAVELLADLGAKRITLAREMSLAQIAELAANASVELEVFAHGALCVAYSGQCLTSEAIGGRSANRGACAQACRLPYDLLVDGVVRDLGDVAYPLSPKDLDASELMPELLASGVSAIKIEGRMKGPDYVAATTRLYRLALDSALGHGGNAGCSQVRELSAQCFSRGASTGYLRGIDHQGLVDGTTSDHIGLEIGRCLGVKTVGARRGLILSTTRKLSRGDGILVQGGRAGKNELGGRIWNLELLGRDVESVESADEIWVWLGPDRLVVGEVADRRVYRTSLGTAKMELSLAIPKSSDKVPVSARLTGEIGRAPSLVFDAADGRRAEVELDCVLELARNRPIDAAAIRSKLERLGDTRYNLERLDLEIPANCTLAISALNRARRQAVIRLGQAAHRAHRLERGCSMEQEPNWPTKPPAAEGLFVTCRTRDQAYAALSAGAQGIYLDLLRLAGVGPLLRELRASSGASLGVALPRIRKTGEEGIDRYVLDLEPDAVLIRSLGSLASVVEACRSPSDVTTTRQPTWIGDFSLNATNSVAAIELLGSPLAAFTPGHDLDSEQLLELLNSPLGPYAEVVLYHPMPLFHTEHCVIAARLSNGHDHRDCGRPCEQHVVSLRDRTGLVMPLEADVGCRNTIFHGAAQSAAELLPRLLGHGVRRYRVELVRETREQTAAIVREHVELIAGRSSAAELRGRLLALGLRMVRGSLRAVG